MGRTPTTPAGERTGTGALASLPPLRPLPSVSVIIPALNEERYIVACIEAFLAQDYPHDAMELIVADGGSTDATRALVADLAARPGPRPSIRLIDNPGRTTAAGLNAGAAVAAGDILVIFGAHAKPASDFVAESVAALRATGAAAAGGPIETRGEGRLPAAIAAALSHPFGVGDARFRYATGAGEVDTVAFAAYRRECFDLVGGFDLTRDRGEDDHFNWRIRDAGGRLWLTPAIRSVYYARGDFRSLGRQYLAYGRAKGRALAEEPRSLRPRHLAPASTVVAGTVLALLGLRFTPARLMLGLGAGAYGLLAAISARQAARRSPGTPTGLTMLAFPVIHAAYGAGTFAGVWRAFRARLRAR